MKQHPPRFAIHLLHLFCPPHRVEEMEGDLDELFRQRVDEVGLRQARWRYVRDVVSLLRPSLMKREENLYPRPTNTTMIRNYLKIALRNLTRYKVYSFINIAGLATGMAVATLIGLWMYDELAFDRSFQQYDRIAQVKQHGTFNGSIQTWPTVPLPMGEELRRTYGSDFKYVVMSSWPEAHFLTVGDKALNKAGNYMEPEATELFSLNMRKGTRNGLQDPYSILLSESTANAFFGDADPMGKLLKIDNKLDVKVTGVYEDFPANSSFANVNYISPWELKLINDKWLKEMQNPWGNNSLLTYVQLADHADLDKVSTKIRDAKLRRVHAAERRYHPQIFLHPMSKWHLYAEFKGGINTGGPIEFVWLFGIIGLFVLLLACINFMNLSTARSEKRAKEVGIRKAVGSIRYQLIMQFFSESFLVVLFAFCLALVLVQFSLPAFNEVADKRLSIPWLNLSFWVLGGSFSLLTGLVAGSYPAFYLSSFQAVNVLKGTFRVGRFASVPRQVLVVVQFTVSVTLIIGTVIVYRQIQFAKSRPIGYSRDGLVSIQLLSKDIHKHVDVVRDELKKSGAVVEMAESAGPVTGVWSTNGGFDWKGKEPGLAVDFPNTSVSVDYGKTVGWTFTEGRDFSREFPSDSMAFVLNEAAVKYMGLTGSPVGEIIKWDGHPMKVIGVIKDMIMESPYQPVRPSLFNNINNHDNFVILKLNPQKSASESIHTIEAVFKKYAPAAPFDYKFVDLEYARKFGNEERIGTLASFFAVLAIFISCLGLFGLASFVAEQRTKEIGVRKVLGASVLNLWSLLSKDFVVLVIIAFGIAIPIASYFLNSWLQKYEYRTELSWWIFAASGAGALLITLLTVSFQSVKAALMNPVKSLRSE